MYLHVYMGNFLGAFLSPFHPTEARVMDCADKVFDDTGEKRPIRNS